MIDICNGHNELPDFSRIDLYSHANMVVVGCHAEMIEDTRRMASVNPFNSSYNAFDEVHIADAEILYNCLYTGLPHTDMP